MTTFIIKKLFILFSFFLLLFIFQAKINYKSSDFLKERKKLIYYNISNDENDYCHYYDPFTIFNDIFNKDPLYVCKSSQSRHLCYKNTSPISIIKGFFCLMENFVLDPFKWKSDGFKYLGPVNKRTRGLPLLEKGFFNMRCRYINKINHYFYNFYFNSWNYKFNDNNNYKELAPNKVVFFVSRNQDSPNLFWGGSGVINALATLYYFNFKPEDIQVVFLESMSMENDPNYVFYEKIISKGNKPIHIKELKKKYHISKAIHIPLNWDSSCYINFTHIPKCKYQSHAYNILNKYIDKNMNLTNFKEPIDYDKETYYYPKGVKDPASSIFTKYLTIQWRKAWPKERKGQGRLMGNGPELVEKLYQKLPKNILIRLVDTGRLLMIEQISLMKKTDYLLGIHGAGLFLSVFLPSKSILHEISTPQKTQNLLLASNLSGHKTYSNILKAEIKYINDNEYIFFNPDEVSNIVLKNIEENNFKK